MERLFSMVLRRLMNKGMNAGFKAMSRRGEDKQDPAARKTNKPVPQNSRGLREATRMLRRMGRFKL